MSLVPSPLLKGSPPHIHAGPIWALPVRGGGGEFSTLARMVLGSFFGKNLLDFRGSRPLPGGFGALFSEMMCHRVPV